MDSLLEASCPLVVLKTRRAHMRLLHKPVKLVRLLMRSPRLIDEEPLSPPGVVEPLDAITPEEYTSMPVPVVR